MLGNKGKRTAALPGLSLLKGVIPAAGSLAFIIYISYLGWMSLGPDKPVPDEKRQAIAVQSVEKIAEQLRKERNGISEAVLLHFANDNSDFVSDSLRNLLNSNGVINLEDRPFSEKLRNKFRLINKGVSSREAALKSAREYKTPGVIWGKIERFESSPDGALIKGRWELLNTQDGSVVINGIIDEDSTRKIPVAAEAESKSPGVSAEDPAEPSGRLSLPLRLAGFLLCMLMVPLVTFSFIRTLIAKGSNGINGAMLGILTLIDLILAYFMVSGAFVTPAGVFLFLGAGAAAFFYNIFMLRFAKKLES